MTMYSVRYTHKISPSDKDVGPGVQLSPNDFSDSKRLARALRERGILCSGQRLLSFRVEGDKVLCFPAKSIWHAIVLTHEGE